MCVCVIEITWMLQSPVNMKKVLNGMKAVMNHKVFILFDNHHLSLPAVTLQGVWVVG